MSILAKTLSVAAIAGWIGYVLPVISSNFSSQRPAFAHAEIDILEKEPNWNDAKIAEALTVINETLDAALDSFNRREHTQAIALASSAIELITPLASYYAQHLSFAYVIRGQARAFSKDDDGALEDYANALALNDKLTWIFGARAYIYLRRGSFLQAERDVKRALAHEPNSLDLQHSLGDVYYYSGRFDEARKHWRSSCKAATKHDVASIQSRLSEIKRFSQPADGKCSRALIDAFEVCAKEKCQF
ncbi:MAG: hypothetical protein AAFZ01_05875 [Pseudomonadota bacterium]